MRTSGHRFGVLFDVDGTLVDSTYVHTICWWQALRSAGHDATMAVVHHAVGMGAGQLIEQVLGADHEDEVEALQAAHDAIYSTYWSQLRRLPGASELLQRCHADGYAVILASSAGASEVAALTKVLDADDLISVVTTSADAGQAKPAPDLLGVAMKKADLAPDQVVYVGDAVWDVEAASRAGVACIGVACGGTPAAELAAAGAVATFADPADLLTHFDQLVEVLTNARPQQTGAML